MSVVTYTQKPASHQSKTSQFYYKSSTLRAGWLCWLHLALIKGRSGSVRLPKSCTFIIGVNMVKSVNYM